MPRLRIYLHAQSLREIMVRQHLRQRHLAKRVGVTPHHFSDLMAQRYATSPEIRDRIQVAFRWYSWERLFVIRDKPTT